MTTPGALAAATAVAMVTALCSSSCRRSRAIDPAPAAAESAARATADSVALDRHTRGWEVGQRIVYRTEIGMVVAFGAGSNSLEFDLFANVEVTPTRSSAESVTLYAAPRDVRAASRVAESQPEFDKLAALLNSTGCFYTLEGGQVTEVRVARDLPPTAANAFRTIGSALQFARSINPLMRYVATEYDSTGQYVAQYERGQEEGLWHKRKLRYVRLLTPKAAANNLSLRIAPEVVRSDGTVRLTPDGRPALVSLKDELLLNGAQTPMRSTTTVSLRSERTELVGQPGPEFERVYAGLEPIRADEPYGAANAVRSLDDARIGGQTFESVLARMEDRARKNQGEPNTKRNGTNASSTELAAEKAETQEDSRAFIALSAMVRRAPETVARAVAAIRKGSPASATLVDCLGSASSPDADEALIALKDSKSLDAGIRTRIVAALSRSSRPSNRSTEALEALLVEDPFSTQALFGLGTYCRRYRDQENKDETKRLGELLLGRLAMAKTQSDVITVLRAITNSGYDAALARLGPYLKDEREPVRVAAVRALQSMHSTGIDEILASHLRSDSSRDVRVSAIDASKVRQPNDSMATALVSVATDSSADPHVRYRAVELMNLWRTRRPDMRNALEQVAAKDQEPRVRDLAKASLL